MRIVFHRSTFR